MFNERVRKMLLLCTSDGNGLSRSGDEVMDAVLGVVEQVVRVESGDSATAGITIIIMMKRVVVLVVEACW